MKMPKKLYPDRAVCAIIIIFMIILLHIIWSNKYLDYGKIFSHHLTDRNFQGTSSSFEDFNGYDFASSNFSHSCLESSFRNCNLENANLSNSDVHFAKFIESSMQGVSLDHCNLTKAVFYRTNLQQRQLSKR